MVTKSATAPAPAPRTARDRLLAAADELFYGEGIHTVGIDRVIERAGVAKATLYSSFGNKEGLIRAYLQGRFADRQDRVSRALAPLDDPRAKILAVFDVLRRAAEESDFHGCAFMNATAESAIDSAAASVSETSRSWNRALFTQLAREVGAADTELLANQLVLLYDGAIVSARMDRDIAAVETAKVTAAAIVDASVAAA